MIVNKGKFLFNYRKTFLYETDYKWAKEGQKFSCFELENIGKIGIGICMDLNPKVNFSKFFLFKK